MIKQKRTLTASQKKLCAASQAWKCKHCNCILPASFEIDHVLALIDGGTDDPANLVAVRSPVSMYLVA